MAHSAHRRGKGCSLCKGYKFRDHGQALGQPTSTLCRVGKKRRVTRHDLGDEER